MANWSTLKAAVASIINTNGNQAITGQLLQNVLNNIITNVGENSTFAGIATVDTNPGAPDGPVFYLVTTAGTYSNFNSIEVLDGEAAIFEWNNGTWTKKVTGFSTQEKLSQLDLKVSRNENITLPTGEYGYTAYESGLRDSKTVRATYLFNNNGYSTIKVTCGFDSNYYAAIAFYSASAQTVEGYLKSESVQAKEGVNTYIAKVPENCKLIAVCNRPTSLAQPIVEAYSDIDFTKLSKYINGFLFGDFYVDINTGDVKAVSDIDVYYGDTSLFHRFSANSVLFNITKVTGTNSVVFKPETKELVYGASEGIIVGITNGKYFYPYGTCNVEYSNGKKDKNTKLLTEEILSLGDKVNSFLFGDFYVDINTGDVVSTSNVDIFYGSNYTLFHRFSANSVLFNITKVSGTNSVVFKPETKELVYGASEGIIVGITNGRYFYPNGSCSVEYSNGKLNNSTRLLTERLLSLEEKVNGYLFGDFYVDINTGNVISTTNVDIYYGSNTLFHRFSSNEILFNITKVSGTNSVVFDTDTKKFTYGATKGIIVGITSGKYFYPYGTCSVEYSNGKKDKNTRLLTEEVLSLTKKVDDTVALPNFVNEAANNTWKRLIEWVGSDDVALIAQITDVHSGGNDRYLHVGYLNKLNDLFSFDLLANMGDIGIDYSSSETQSEMMQLVNNIKSRMSTTSPWVFCKGNHEGKLNDSNVILGNIFNRDIRNRKPLYVEFGDSSKNYGYYDVEAHKLRVYFLNTTDTNNVTNGYALSTEQVQWVADTLAEVQEGWNVVVLTHLCIEACGRTTNETGTMRYGIFDNLCLVMEGFNAKNSGLKMVNWDFTASKAGKIVCNLCGDSHFNNNAVVNGLNYIVRQGYGQGGSEYLPSGATKDVFDSNVNCLFDVLAIKRDGNAKIFRIGVGESSRDLSFTY